MAIQDENLLSLDLSLDGQGHLTDANDWNREVAAQLAAREGLELTAERLRICVCVRQFHERFGVEPTHRALARFIAAELGPEQSSSSWLALQFPGGVLRQASRIAGLPKPRHCL